METWNRTAILMTLKLESFWVKPGFPVKSRLAPTPSGFIHLGNELNFILTWLLVRSRQGKLVLRIDDMDRERFRPAYLEDLFFRLEELGLDWDEGPIGPEDFEKNWSQTLRIERYAETLKKLLDRDLIYPCFCTRKTGACSCESHQNPLDFPDLPWRILCKKTQVIQEEELRSFCGLNPITLPFSNHLFASELNFVVKRRDGKPAYQICSLTDDYDLGINLVVRGEDLLGSSLNQLFLARQIGMHYFEESWFIHHPILADNDGKKISKSTGNQPVRLSKNQVFEEFGKWMGWKKGPENLNQCLELFQETKSKQP